ncbi:MAG: copper homeostasis periplasmic binding protein CopC [Hyphomicrobiales bacterium]
MSGHALAHAKLLSSEPAENGMAMPPPTKIRLKFSEPIEVKFAKIEIAGPDKKPVAIGPLKLDEKDDTVVIVPLAAPLADGDYTVNWQVVAKDMHKTKGSFGFESMQ